RQSSQQRGLAPRGPVMSPDDPRYGRPTAYSPPPAYSDRGPAPAPAYSDRGPAPIYSDRGPPQGADFTDRPRPPGTVDGAPTGALDLQAPGTAQGANGRSVMSALPPEEQPETGPRKELPERLRRQEVNYPTKEPAGTIIVDTPNTQLYYILGNGRAIRYGVRVGRDGFTWTGVQKITRKAEWPDWHPPAEMIERQPYLPRFM
ncbi:MAG TPA: L,D-transpeptidase, partial [Afipia sp.]|nr:L,D-transpeptidase [Afipia sp.]